MMDLKMEVYSPTLELLGLLEIQKSVIWQEKAFSAGSFSLESIITDESRALLTPENIIWIEGETAGIIEYVHEEAGADGPYISVKGYTLTGILERRILWGLYSMTGTVPEIMRYLVEDCAVNPTRGDAEARKIPGLVALDAPTGGTSIKLQKTGGTLLEALEELGEAYNVAFGVRFNPAVPRMEFWTRWGQNRSVQQDVNEPVFYSTELDDVLSSEYVYNAQNYKNITLVAGEGEGKNRITVTVTENGETAASNAVGFVVLGDAAAMRTADNREFSTLALTADGGVYQSAYTGPQIDEAVGKALSGTGTVGPQGPAGKDASINGMNVLEIVAGENVTIDQDGGTLTISATGGSGTTGVSSFKGRTGAVVPQTGDYTAEMVGAATVAQVNSAIQSAVLSTWEASY